MSGRLAPPAAAPAAARPYGRGGELARCRASAWLDEAGCIAWFGVGRSTIDRIERGEVEPGDEVAQRIDRFLAVDGGRGDVPFTGPRPAPCVDRAHLAGAVPDGRRRPFCSKEA